MKHIKTTNSGLLKFYNLTAITSKTVADELGVPHKNLMRNVKKAEKYLKSRGSHMSPQTLNFNPIFKDYSYENRGKTYCCKLMNMDAVSTMIKVTDTQEAFNYFTVLMSEFNNMELERFVREESKIEQKSMTDSIQKLEALLKDEDSGSSGRMYTTINKQIRNAVGISKDSELDELKAAQANTIADYRHNVDIQIEWMLGEGYTGRKIRDSIKEFLSPSKPMSYKKSKKLYQAEGN